MDEKWSFAKTIDCFRSTTFLYIKFKFNRNIILKIVIKYCFNTFC